MKLAIDIIGWIGAGGVLLAYALVSTGRVAAASYTYQWLNLAGAAGLAINTLHYTAYPSMALNVVWAAIALYAIGNLARLRRGAAPCGPE
jgi:hypothetical protein